MRLPRLARLVILPAVGVLALAGPATSAAQEPISAAVQPAVAQPAAAQPAAPGAAASAGPGQASAPAPAPVHPVAARSSSLPLSGVDRSAAQALGAASAQGARPGVRGGAALASALRSATVLTAPVPVAAFQTVGVTWRPVSTPPDLLVMVRTRSAPSGQWGAWTTLDQDDDDGSLDPVAASGLSVRAAAAAGLRGGTAGLWAGPSTGVQVCVVLRSGSLPPDLRAELIDSGASPGDQETAATSSQGVASSQATTSSRAPGGGLSEPLIYSRASWGADESRVRRTPTLMPTITAAVMHHTAGPNNYSRSQVPKIIRGDYAYHLKRGWSDIGYNALVDRFGRIWEGRAGGLTNNVMGAHAGGFNASTFGVSVIGNYDVSRPTSASVEAVARVFAWKLDVNHRNPAGTTRLTSAGGGTARYRAGTTVTLPVVMGHRNTGFTACPGRYLYPYLPAIRRRAGALMGAALMEPSRSPATSTPGSPSWISARSLVAQSWVLTVTSGCDGSTVAQVRGRAGQGQAFTARWDGTTGGQPAQPGSYTLTLTSRSGSVLARPLTHTVLVVPPVVPDAAPGTPSTGSGGYQPVTPARLTDASGNSALVTWPQGRADVPVLGRAGVPASGVTSVVLNLTITCTSSPATLQVWPTGGTKTSQPVTAVPAGGARSVLVTSQVGAGGSVSLITSTGVAHVTADIVGYYTATGSRVRAVPALRVLETASAGGPVAAGASVPVTLPATVGGVPAAQITAVLADISAISPAGPGTLTAHATGDSAALPGLVFRGGRSTDNLAIVPVRSGAFQITASGSATDVTADIRGIVTDGSVGGGYGLTAITPVRVLASGVLSAGSPRTATVTGGSTGVPAGVAGVLVGIAVANPKASASLEVYPAGTTPGRTAALRLGRDDSRGTVMLVPVGPDGRLSLKLGAGSARVAMDVRGYLS